MGENSNIEQPVNPMSRVEAELRGEDIRPMSRVEALLKEGGSGGSTVLITPTVSTGTKIADYSIDGNEGALYAPEGGPVDVQVNDVTVVDPNGVAKIKSYKEITQEQWDNLPASKYSDDILYLITDRDGFVEIVGTLTAGQTSLVLQSQAITVNSTFDYYTSIFGVNPTDATVAAGSLTLTFEAQQSDMNVKVRVS